MFIARDVLPTDGRAATTIISPGLSPCSFSSRYLYPVERPSSSFPFDSNIRSIRAKLSSTALCQDIVELADGTLLLNWFTSVAFAEYDDPSLKKYKEHFASLPAETVRRELGYWTARSTDGGMTWSKPWPGAKHPDYDLCEPCLFYSPDKSEIGMIIRENRGCGVAQMCFSKDEGRTWTKVQDAPLDLYGERHVVQRLPDGRYFFAFRSQEKKSPHVYGWVGPYEGIRDGSGKGGYRMKLFHNDTYWWDCGYQGVHLAANGEIVVTTYTCLAFKPQCGTPDIESMHFRIADADRLHANPPAEKDPMLGKYHMFGDYTRGSADRPFRRYNKNLDKAFAFLKRKDLKTLPVGTYELGEKKGEVFAMVQEVELTPYNSAVEHVEVHAKYIDIQAPLDGEETFGVANVDATRADIGFDAAKDIGFTDVPTGTRTIGPGEFAMFFPGKGGHAPCRSLTGKRRIHKVVIKVLRDR